MTIVVTVFEPKQPLSQAVLEAGRAHDWAVWAQRGMLSACVGQSADSRRSDQ